MSVLVGSRVSPTTDLDLPTFDNTQLVGLNTCPTWGIVRYVHHKSMYMGRAMALEAGGAAHQVFAAFRFWSLLTYGEEFYGEDWPEFKLHVARRGERTFGRTTWGNMLLALDSDEDERRRKINFCLEALSASGFYDDPLDKNRTYSNIEEMCIHYMDRVTHRKSMPVVRTDGFVGIEVPYDVTIEFDEQHDEGILTVKYRFIGRVDGVHYKSQADRRIEIQDNKTASRLDDAWENSWNISNQPTGYCLALSSILHTQIYDVRIIGSSLPMPRDYGRGIVEVPSKRAAGHFVEWIMWAYDTIKVREKWEKHPLDAPKYTHSCNRYFRTCPFMPLCDTPRTDRMEIYEAMYHDEWNPLEEGSA